MIHSHVCYCSGCGRSTVHDDEGRCTVKDCGFLAVAPPRQLPTPQQVPETTVQKQWLDFLENVRRVVAETKEWHQ